MSIRRTDAYGDVIMGSILASKMNDLGFDVAFASSQPTRRALQNHPHIASFIDNGGPVDVNLDGAYENHPHRTQKDGMLLMLEAAAPQLQALGMPLPHFGNRVPTLAMTSAETERIKEYLSDYPKPWVVIVHRSGAWPSRTISEKSVADACRMIPGTKFWAFPSQAPPETVQFQMTNFRDLMAIISECDLLICPDTGPLHVGAAFNRKMVVHESNLFTSLRLTNLTDYTSVSAPLSCIGCGEWRCPINEMLPPCQNVPAHALAHAAVIKLGAAINGKVSAIIPVYRMDQRLMRCLDAVRDQVDEIIVSMDNPGSVTGNMGPKVRVVLSDQPARSGYGKTCMRGARHATGEFLLMLNDDCYLKPGAVAAMRDAMTAKVAVVGAQLWYPDGTLQHGGTFRRIGDMGFGHVDFRKTVPSIRKVTELEFVSFASALVRRSAFYSVRGFDEEYDCYSEDSDLCLKLRQGGWKVMYQPDAVGIHDESQSTSEMKTKLLMQGTQILQRKWSNYFLKTTPIS